MENAPRGVSKSVRLDVFALPATPTIGSIEPCLRAVITERGTPFRAASSLPAATRWASPAIAAGDAPLLASVCAVAAPGLETTFVPSAAAPLPVLGCTATTAGVELFFEVVADATHGHERAVLREPLAEGATGMLFLPAPDATFAGHALVVTVVGPAAADDVVAADATAHAAAAAASLSTPSERQLDLAAAAIGAQSRRAAMLAVTAQLELPQCTDVLLAADETRLIAIGDELARLDATRPDYPWAFERALWSALVPGLQRDQLPPGLTAAVVRQLGAVAAEPSVLQLHLQTSTDATAFATTLRQENVYALAERDPVLRVRAHDWLVARGHAVAGYEPLAPEPDRSSALRAAARAEGAR